MSSVTAGFLKINAGYKFRTTGTLKPTSSTKPIKHKTHYRNNSLFKVYRAYDKERLLQ